MLRKKIPKSKSQNPKNIPWILAIGFWLFRSRAVIIGVLLAFPAPAFACRYNIREIGFVNVGQPKFRLAVFIHGDEHDAWLPGFHSTATHTLGMSNVTWDIVDEVKESASPDLRYRAQLGPRLPGGMVLQQGREDGWPVFLHVPDAELQDRLTALADSPARARIADAVIDSYGAVLLLRGLDDAANDSARLLAQESIQAITATLTDLPKRIARGPQLVEADPSLPAEQILAWSLGVNGRDLPQPVVAVVYGRGRLAGPALSGEQLTAARLRDQLSLVGADCECALDHSWMTAGSIPLAISAEQESRIPQVLGFDPAAAPVVAEVHQILATQAQAARDPAASRGGGYRETPLEIVPIAPGLPVPADPAGSVAEKKMDEPRSGWMAAAAAMAGAVLFVLLRRKLRR